MQENKIFDLWLDKWFTPFLITGILLNLSGIFITIIEPDGALYASVAKQMALRNDFINLYAEGKDWLDKPHFPFWITALSYKAFGINTFAYKLPALLFWLMGALYTFKFSKLIYNKSVARLAVLIYITAEHLIISNNDVRAEPYLTGLIIASVYFYYKAQHKKWFWHIVSGSLFAACAVMTKGVFVLVFIGGGFIIHWLLKKEYKQFFHYKWVVAVILTFIFIIPELYTLYIQFDAHPEKFVFGKQNVSGIKFFFWDSQFGRFNNTGPIKGKGDPFFFIHTLLWAFIPWSLILFAALFKNIKSIFTKHTLAEYISTGTSVVAILLFSISKFQLPHYTNIIFSFLAIITAHYIYTLNKGTKTITTMQFVQAALLAALTFSLTFLFKPSGFVFSILWVVVIVAIAFFLFRKLSLQNAIGISVLCSLLVNGFMNMFFYPQILQYQSATTAAKWLNANPVNEKVAIYKMPGYSLDFYSNQPVAYYNMDSVLSKTKTSPIIIYTLEENMGDFKERGLNTETIQEFEHFPVTKLKMGFVNSNTRSTAIKKAILVKLSMPDNQVISGK